MARLTKGVQDIIACNLLFMIYYLFLNYNLMKYEFTGNVHLRLNKKI